MHDGVAIKRPRVNGSGSWEHHVGATINVSGVFGGAGVAPRLTAALVPALQS